MMHEFKWMFCLALFVLCPLTAAATPVSISVEPWRTTDGNFGFSVIHEATGGLMQRGGSNFYAGGSISYAFSDPVQFMTGDLTGSVPTLDASSLLLDGGSLFNIESAVLDFSVAAGSVIGLLGYELVDVGGSVESGSFYFYNFDYTDGSCDANGLCVDSGQYRRWGNNWENAIHDKPQGSVFVDGVLATRFRGIDLGGEIVSAPVPEPSAALLFGFGALIVGSRLHRR